MGSQGVLAPEMDALLAPWRAHAPAVFTLGLQKTGTTLAGAVLSAAMNVRYSPEAAMDCCIANGWESCARNHEDYKEKYNFLGHGMFFSDLRAVEQRGQNMHRFFARCAHHTLLGPEQQVVNTETGLYEPKRWPITVLKADEMMPDSLSLANFARAQKLNLRFIFVTRQASYWHFCIVAAVWGLADGAWYTMIPSHLSATFTNEAATAFAVKTLFEVICAGHNH